MSTVRPSPLRLAPLPLPRVGPANRLARAGVRAFQARGPGPRDLVLAHPAARGLHLVAPRGFGHPMLARVVAGGYRAEPTGEPCSAVRWVPIGGVGAWLREVPLTLAPLAQRSSVSNAGREGVLCLRPASLALAAARRADPSLGRAPVAVVAGRVVAVSGAAEAAGVARGQSLAVARRRCPGLRTVGPAGGEALAVELTALLEAELGPVRRVGADWLVPFPAVDAADTLARATRLALRVWQRCGVEARVVAAADEADARGLVGLLHPGIAAVVPTEAAGAWAARGASAARWMAGPRRASWSGAPVPDLEGAAALLQGLSESLRGAAEGAALLFTVDGDGGRVTARVPVPPGIEPGELAARVDSVARPMLARAPGVRALKMRVVARRRGGVAPPSLPAERAPRQLALLPGVR